MTAEIAVTDQMTVVDAGIPIAALKIAARAVSLKVADQKLPVLPVQQIPAKTVFSSPANHWPSIAVGLPLRLRHLFQ
jgi:hypothetical protein